MMNDTQQPRVYTQFAGNLDFYNDPRYRKANKLHWEAILLLKECGMTHNQACDWMRSWGYLEDGD